jgi:hypothetical protein
MKNNKLKIISNKIIKENDDFNKIFSINYDL